MADLAGELRPGATIVEGTSGSTGVSLALMALAHGYKCEIVMPDGKSSLRVVMASTSTAGQCSGQHQHQHRRPVPRSSRLLEASTAGRPVL